MSELINKWDCGVVENTVFAYLYSDGVFEFRGNGDIKDYATTIDGNNIIHNDSPWDSYRNGEIKKIYLYEGITGIGANCFYGFDFKEVYIASTVTKIGDSTFGGYGSSVNVVFFGNSPELLGRKNAFVNLTNIKIIYNNNYSDWNIVISEANDTNYYGGSPYPTFTGKNIHSWDCGTISGNITSFIYDYTHTFIGEGEIKDYESGKAPWNSYTQSTINIDNRITRIGTYCFENNNELTKIIFGLNLIEVGDYSFYTCTNLSEIIFTGNFKTFGKYSFANCKIKELTLPSTVTKIDDYAFSNSTENMKINFLCNPPRLGNNPFNNNQIEAYYDERVELWSTEIRTTTYGGATNVVWRVFQDMVFDCGTTENTVTATLNIPSNTITFTGNGEIKNYEINNQPWFVAIKNIKNVIIDKNITGIGKNCFNSYNFITNVNIGENVNKISDNAFSDCERIETIVLKCKPPELGITPFNRLQNIIIKYDSLFDEWTSDLLTDTYGGAEGVTWLKNENILISLLGLKYFYKKLKEWIISKLDLKADNILATTHNNGLMSSEDKTKLDNIDGSGSSVSWQSLRTRGDVIGVLTIDKTPNTLYYEPEIYMTNEEIDKIIDE